MTYEAGQTLSHFRLIEKIGEGGMGVVWKAEDEKLQRVVALKVLPLEKLADDERRLRFVREARTAAAVTHPNIAVVHEIDEADGVVFIAMELIEGKTLRETIAGKPMPLREALRLGVEVAEGLSAAHQAKVIHRDLKPDNVIVTPGGHVKILDFGLAKLLEERAAIDPAEASKLATVSDEMTQAGRVLGTAAYMSPEQARGLAVDARSDLFSFGIVLYEMVTGKAPFRGTTSMDTLTAILREQPVPAVQLNPEVPAEMERILGKCLEKAPGERYQDARDLVVDLRRLKRDSESQPLRKAEVTAPTAAVDGSRRSIWKSLAWSVAALVLIGIAGIASWKFLPSWKPKRETTQRQITANPPDNPVVYPQISPDGRFLSYFDQGGIQVLRIETGETQPLRLPEGFEPSPSDWLPDGTGMLVAARESPGKPRALWNVSLLGGPPRKILDEVGSWWMSPDGKHLAYNKSSRGETWIAGPRGESPRSFLSNAENEISSVFGWSPDSRRLVFLRGRLESEGPSLTVRSRALAGGPEEEILLDDRDCVNLGTNTAFWWLRDGRFLFPQAEAPPNETDVNLWAVKVDPATGKRSGPAERLTNWVGAEVTAPSATADGSRLAVLRTRVQTDIYVADVDPDGQAMRNARRLTKDERDDFGPSWTPDGRFVIFTSARGGTLDLFKQGVDAATAEPLVAASGQQVGWGVTSDGHLLYEEFSGAGSFAGAARRRGPRTVMSIPVHGGSSRVVNLGQNAAAIDCAAKAPCVIREAEGTALTISRWDPDRGPGVKLAHLEWPDRQLGITALSPDGKQLAMAPEGAVVGRHVTLISLTDGTSRVLSPDRSQGILALAWSASSDALFAITASDVNTIMRSIVRIDMSGRTSVLLEYQGQVPIHLSVSPDGRHVAYTVATIDSNVWLLENF